MVENVPIDDLLRMVSKGLDDFRATERYPEGLEPGSGAENRVGQDGKNKSSDDIISVKVLNSASP